MYCEECNALNPTLACTECDEVFCQNCYDVIHRGGKRKYHIKQIKCTHCSSLAQRKCSNCEVLFCEKCINNHFGHTCEILPTNNKVSVFWDLHSCRINKKEDIKSTIKDIQKIYENITEIKAFGENHQKWRTTFDKFGIELIVYKELQNIETFILELSVTAGKYLTNILVLSSNAAYMKPHLTRIQNNLPNATLLFSLSIFPLDIKSISMLPEPFGFYRIASLPDLKISESSHIQTEKFNESKRLHNKFHSFNTIIEQNSDINCLIERLKSFAEKGQIMVDLSLLITDFSIKYGFDSENCSKIIDEACSLGIAFLTRKQFGEFSPKIFMGLKLENLNLENLSWVLESLKIDEFLPTEKIIQSRIKEAFDIKLDNFQWESLLVECKNSSNFQLIEINVLQNDINSYVIFPSEEQWFSYDQYIKAGDPINIKSTNEWKSLIDFFKKYFKGSSDANLAIQGGRYGCGQLVKFYGPTNLAELSLGKLSYMVQLVIDEDILRYNKALLVLNPQLEDKIEDENLQMTLEMIKTNIIEVLKEAKDGIPLAQIPLHLKKKSPNIYHIAKFGFPKLKDLLLTMKNIKIETKEAFQLYAFYEIKIKQEDIVAEITALEDFSNAEQHLFSKFGTIEWSDYDCNSIDEFINLNHLEYKRLENKFPTQNKIDFHIPFIDTNFSPLFLKESMDRKNSIYEIGTTSEDQFHTKFVEDLLSDGESAENSQIIPSRLDPNAAPFSLKMKT